MQVDVGLGSMHHLITARLGEKSKFPTWPPLTPKVGGSSLLASGMKVLILYLTLSDMRRGEGRLGHLVIAC